MLVHLYYIYTTQLDGTQNRELAGDGNLAETLQEGQTTIQEVGAPRSLLPLIIRPDANGNAQACHFFNSFFIFIFLDNVNETPLLYGRRYADVCE